MRVFVVAGGRIASGGEGDLKFVHMGRRMDAGQAGGRMCV